MKNFVQSGGVVTVTAPAAVVSGAPVMAGSLFGVALSNAASGAPVQISVAGIASLPKATGQAWTVGQLLYWSGTAATTTSGSNPMIGCAIAAAASGDSVGAVRMNGAAVIAVAAPPPVPVGEWDVQVTGPNEITVFAMPTFYRPIASATAANQITVSAEEEAMPTAFVIAPAAHADTDLTGATVVAFTGLPQVINGIAAGSIQVGAYGVFDTPLTVSNPGDTTAPVLSGVSVTDTDTTATLAWSTNEANGTAFYLVDANPTRTAAQVIAGGAIAGSRAVTATGAQTAFTATGLTAATSYFFHLVHRDAANNSSTVSSTAFTTEAASAFVDLISIKDWTNAAWVKATGAAKVVEDGWLLAPDGVVRLDTQASWALPGGQTLTSIAGQVLTVVVDVATYGGNTSPSARLSVVAGPQTQFPLGFSTATGLATLPSQVRPLANGRFRLFTKIDLAALSNPITRLYFDVPLATGPNTQFSRPSIFVGDLTVEQIDALPESTTPRVPA